MATATVLFDEQPAIQPRFPEVDILEETYPDNPGLCVTCNHGDSCSLKQSSADAIHRCEEFESDLPLPTTMPRTTAGAPEEAPDPFRYSGLCANCDNRRDCMYARSTGGVWTCEEYA